MQPEPREHPTGRYPHNTGAEQLHWPVPAEQEMFVESLKESGYWTASAGKWHLGPAAKSKFDKVTEGKVDWVETLRRAGRRSSHSFCGWLRWTHTGRISTGAIREPHRPEDVVVPPSLPDVPETRTDLAMYYDEISRLDTARGNVLAELDRQKIADETFVLFISDNGRPFPASEDHRVRQRNPDAVHYPLAGVAWRPAAPCKSLVSSVDIGPTILELAGVERRRRCRA